MPPRYQSTLLTFEEKARNLFDHFGQPAHRGHARVGSGLPVGGLGQSLIQNPTAEAETSGAAHLLTMSVTSGAISAGGDTVPFDTIVAQHGFDDVVDPFGGAWVHPVSGVYMLVVKLAWDTFTGGGTVQLVIDGTALPEGLILVGDDWDTMFGVLPYRATTGSVGEVRVTHSDVSAQACDASVSIAITDPDKVEATVPAGSDWELVFAADVYDLTHDGSNWWTTDGNDGVTVTERDADGVVVSTFEASALTVGTGGNPPKVRGITFDGTDLWLTGGADSKVVEYSTAGALVSTFSRAGGEQSDTGIVWDGTQLWVGGLNLKQLRRYTTSGTLSTTIALGFGPRGAALYGSTLYVIDQASQQIRTYSLAGVEGTPVDISDAPINPTGVWIAADGTLYISLEGVGVYRRLTGL